MKYFIIIAILILHLLILNPAFAQKGMKRPAKLAEVLSDEVVYRNGWALIVGINKYPYLPPRLQLNYAVADAEALSELLQRRFGFEKSNITLLKDEQATKGNIMDALSDLADLTKVKEEDCILVYFSGHGQTVSLPSGGEMGFLVTYDAQVELTAEPNAAQYYRYCIGMDELNRVAKLIPARHIIFIVDACYSGLVLPASRGISPQIPAYLKKVASVPAQQMITAGGVGEESMELPELGHGLFTYKLIEGLDRGVADMDDDGVITGSELGTYLRMAVLRMPNSKQTPNFRMAGEGEFLFIPQVESGTLQIQLDPSDAMVTITPLGASDKSPYITSAGEISLPPGIYTLSAEKDGYETSVKDSVEVTGNTKSMVTLVLKPKPARITAPNLPQNVRVFVNGSPASLPHQVTPGTYTIRLERDGFQPVEMRELLKPSQDFVLNPSWIPVAPQKTEPLQTPTVAESDSLAGTLRVNVDPADANVRISLRGLSKGFLLPPTGEIDLPAGTYTVTAEKDGYESVIKDRVEITNGKETLLTFSLKPKIPSPSTSIDQDMTFQPGFPSRGISPIEAFGASLIIPGLGQHLQGHSSRGFLYEGLVAGVGIIAIGATIYHQTTLNDYIDIREQLVMESTRQTEYTDKIQSLLTEQNDAYDKATSARTLAIATQITFGVLWGINALDAALISGSTQKSDYAVLEVQPTSDGGKLVVRARF